MLARRTLPVLAFSTLSFSMAQTATVPAIGQMALSLGASRSEILWTHSAYLISAAICTPIVGRLGDTLGKKRLLVFALVAFGMGSLIAGFGDRFEVVIGGRLIQGVGGGIFPLCFGVIRDSFPPRRVAASIAAIASILGLASGLGLIFGGILLDHFGWQWIFWSGAAMAGASGLLVIRWIPESPPSPSSKLDLHGAVLLVFGLASLMMGVTMAGTWGFLHSGTLALIALSLVFLVRLAAFEARIPDPLIDIASFRSPTVFMTNLATVLVGFTLFGSFVVISQMAQDSAFGFNLDATEAGLLMIPGCLAMLAASGLVVPISVRLGRAAPLVLGSLLSALGLALIVVAHGSLVGTGIWIVLALAGLGLALANIPNLIVDAVGPARTGEATGINVLVRSVGSALGSQVTASILVGTSVVAGADAGPYEVSIGVCAGVALATAGIAFWIPPPVRPEV